MVSDEFYGMNDIHCWGWEWQEWSRHFPPTSQVLASSPDLKVMQNSDSGTLVTVLFPLC